MSMHRTITLSNDLDIEDIHAIKQAIEYHIPQISITNEADKTDFMITPDLLPTPPYRMGHILDVIEESLFTKKQQENLIKGRYELDCQNLILSIDGRAIELNDRECDVVAYLMEAGNKGCSRDELLKKIWGYRVDLETHAVETQIYRLRQKIEEESDDPQYLITIDNGYKLQGLG